MRKLLLIFAIIFLSTLSFPQSKILNKEIKYPSTGENWTNKLTGEIVHVDTVEFNSFLHINRAEAHVDTAEFNSFLHINSPLAKTCIPAQYEWSTNDFIKTLNDSFYVETKNIHPMENSLEYLGFHVWLWSYKRNITGQNTVCLNVYWNSAFVDMFYYDDTIQINEN